MFIFVLDLYIFSLILTVIDFDQAMKTALSNRDTETINQLLSRKYWRDMGTDMHIISRHTL